MCGRYLVQNPAALRELARRLFGLGLPDFAPRYNVAPSQSMPVIATAPNGAVRAGRTLLVLDTVTGGDGERLYARHGWQRCGEIPNYALFPDGRPCATTVFFKVLDGAPTGGPAEPWTKTAAGRPGVDGNLPRKRGDHAQ